MKSASRIAIDDAIKQCESHLKRTNSWNTNIEFYLTRFLIVFICGEYEKEIEKLVNLRAEVTKDRQVETFVAKTIYRKGWVHYSEIKGQVLGRFGDNYAATFSKLDNTLAANYYENIVKDRMSVSHGGPVINNVSFKELKDTHKEADKVISQLARILGVKRP